MTGYLDKLNLRPSEKRLVVVVVLVVFVVLNLWFVLPRFGDWNRTKKRMQQARQKMAAFQAEISQMKNYQRQVQLMESEGASVPAGDQAVQFARAIQMQQAASGVSIVGTSKQTTRTNQFFLELNQTVSVVSQESQLVDFLYNLGAGNSLIRVRDLTVKPDQSRQQLSSNVKLVASFQKASPPSRTAAANAAGKSGSPVPAPAVTSKTAPAPTRAPATASKAK